MADKELAYIKYLIEKEKCCPLEKEESWVLIDYINEHGYPEEDEEVSKETDWFNLTLELVSKSSPEVAEQMKKELVAQRSRLKLIASENYNSLPVLAAMSSFVVDKYAEGNIGKRYYSGCEQVDAIEQIAVDKAKELFGAEYAYVQPCSGSDANLIAYYSIINKLRNDWVKSGNAVKLMDKPQLLSLDVSCGGHLTHSNPMNIVNELFDVITYGVTEDGWIDMDEVEKIATTVEPEVILAGYSAYPRLLDFKRFRQIADKCGAILMCDMAHFAGLVAGKVLTGVYDPIPYCDIVTSTTQKTLRSGRGGIILAKAEWEKWISKACPMAHGGPLNNMVASKAVGFTEALKPEFREYAQQLVKNTKVLADTLMFHGIKLQTDGTDNHIILINLSDRNINGRQAENALLDCGIVTNRNAIPNDPNGSWYTSGLRIGPAALTSRGMKEEEMKVIGALISDVLNYMEPDGKAGYKLSEGIMNEDKAEVAELLEKFPLYPEIEL